VQKVTQMPAATSCLLLLTRTNSKPFLLALAELCLICRVVSMGRRNTQFEPTLH
jgi:hypothetical protein